MIAAVKCLKRGETLKYVDESNRRKHSKPPSVSTSTSTTAIRPSLPTSTDAIDTASTSSTRVVDFDIILLVDNQEQSTTSRFKSVVDCLRTIDRCTFEMRRLAIGDYLWIARCRHTSVEFVLDWIVERKRWTDFAHSIKERRYFTCHLHLLSVYINRLHEQKQRLRQCGVRNRVLLVENDGTMPIAGRVNDAALHQAMANTQVCYWH